MFCHIEWNRIKADLELQPLPMHTREVIGLLMAVKRYGIDEIPNWWWPPLLRLIELDLASEVEDWEIEDENPTYPCGYGRTWILEGVVERGLLDELLGDRR